MSQLKVSIVIPTYNRATMIGKAVESVLAQCREGDEVIVVDDGSTDNTAEILDRFGDRIRRFHLSNSGAGTARNTGIREARNELLAFLDSDDEWIPGKLDLQRALMEARPDVLYAFSDFAVKYPDGQIANNYLIRWHKDYRPWDEILGPGQNFSDIARLPEEFEDFKVHVGSMYLRMAAESYLCTDTVIVRKEAAGQSLSFDPDVRTYEDWLCFGRLAGAGRGAYMAVETAYQFGHTEARLSDADALTAATARITVLERVWGSNPAFLSRHGDFYRSILENQRTIRAWELLGQGQSETAREELRKVQHAPFRLRLLAALPSGLLKALLLLRRLLKKLVGGR